ncbi:hypothetical protein AB0D12_32950 [Streptomyces sp. NPDC048479]|uniref:hypothetical protein n=1 Tax=Streptomyces sp. NPDC048479 TaxID=3154725 RepID=UPI0034234A2C
MLADISPLIAATAQWLTRAYPSGGGAMDSALSEIQARQAVTVAAWLRYPTSIDMALVTMTGPGGSGRLDWITGADGVGLDDAGEYAWRTWVDEVVVSWAASLLTISELAEAAVAALAGSEHMKGGPVEFRRLVMPDERDRGAAALLRHPDLLGPIAELHHSQLLERLDRGPALTG